MAWLFAAAAQTQETILSFPLPRGGKSATLPASAAAGAPGPAASAMNRPLPLSLAQPAVAEVEPNNTEATAQNLSGDSPIAVDGTVESVDAGQIVIEYSGGPTDDVEDLFKLTIRQPGLKIDLSGVQSDVDIFLFSSPIAAPIIAVSNRTGITDEEINEPTLAAGTYIIGVSIYDSDPIGPSSSPYTLTLTFSNQPAQPPANDECITATVIGALPYTDQVNTTLATVGANDPVLSCADGGRGKTVWYTFTPAQDTYVKASTVGSSPEDYDTALGIFTGTCGALSEIRCNDDAASGGTRHAELSFAASAGQTYIIHVAEWAGGGPGGGVPTGGNLLFSVSVTEPPTLFQGPGTASIPGGASVSTNDFVSGTSSATVQVQRYKQHLALHVGEIELTKNTKNGLHLRGSRAHFVEDTAVDNPAPGMALPARSIDRTAAPFPVRGFPGIADKGSFVPPDPIVAAGPNHLVACVNTDFAIFAKDGALIKQIDATAWFENVLPGLGENLGVAFDPQIVYDHFDQRWVMLYIASDFEAEAYYLISTSDDSDPTGTWCNFAIPAHFNGTTITQVICDYPKMAVDANAIYVTANQFGVSDGFQYVKLYILAKSQFYNNSCGAINWTDFWNLRDPDNFEEPVFTLVPALTFGTPGVEFLINDSPYEVGTFMTLWSLTDPLSATPTLTAINVPVDTSFGEPPNAQQLGGGEPLIHVGGRRVRNAVCRDGSLWTAHSVPGGTDGALALARYVRINTTTATATEDTAFGADKFWYYYPAVMVDQSSNLTMVFNRSGFTEFAGIRYTGRLAGDPPGLQASAQLKAGESNYVKTFGDTRNRWGDYNGIALDPSDNSTIWMFAEYAESPVGPDVSDQRWGTWFGQTTFLPLAGSHISLDPEEIYFGEVDLGDSSASIPISVRSIGTQSLTVTAISDPGNNFVLESLPSLPALIPPGGSIELAARFVPSAVTPLSASVAITSTDAETPTAQIALLGQVAAEIDLSVAALDVTLQTGDMSDRTFTISNLGGTDLAFQIAASGVGIMNPPVAARANELPNERVGYSSAGLPGRGPVLSAPDDAQLFGDFASDAPRGLGRQTETAGGSANTIFSYDVTTAANELFALGVEFDGTNFWVTGAGATGRSDPNRLFKYDLAGNLLATFAQPTVSDFGWRDLAFDGTFLYASESRNIDQIDPATGTATGVTIPAPFDPNRALAYDAATDHFWTANFESEIIEIDRSGNIISRHPNSLSIYGLAWDAISAGGPYLWAWSQDGDGTLASRFSPATGTFSSIAFAGDEVVGGLAGGATFTTALPTTPAGIGVLVALHQSSLDMIVGYLTPPSWISQIHPAGGTVGPLTTQTITVSLDAWNLVPGAYQAALILGSSDHDESRLQIPIAMNVIAAQGRQIRVQPLARDFGQIAAGDSSAPATFSILSIGADTLTISSVASSNPAFRLRNLPALPLALAAGSSVSFAAIFAPTAGGQDSGTITVVSNDLDNSEVAVRLSGYGVAAGIAQPGALYASSGKADGGRLFTIDPARGAATLIGGTGFPAVSGLGINSLGEIYGSTPTDPSTLIRISAVSGAATVVGVMDIGFVDALAFDANDVLYGVTTAENSALYSIDAKTAQTTFIDTTGVDCISGLAFSPEGGLYASTGKGCGEDSGDKIFIIDKNTAKATLLGAVGLGASITDIAFNPAGVFFGLTGSQGQNPNTLITIATATGAGTVVGPTGFVALSGMAFAPENPTAVASADRGAGLPKILALEQNYPNPFNPSTRIRYAIARDGHVVLKIYSLLGQEIRTLVDQKQNANFYEVRWDGKNDAGSPVPSGIYFYQIRSGGHVQTRRMVFLR